MRNTILPSYTSVHSRFYDNHLRPEYTHDTAGGFQTANLTPEDLPTLYAPLPLTKQFSAALTTGSRSMQIGIHAMVDDQILRQVPQTEKLTEQIVMQPAYVRYDNPALARTKWARIVMSSRSGDVTEPYQYTPATAGNTGIASESSDPLAIVSYQAGRLMRGKAYGRFEDIPGATDFPCDPSARPGNMLGVRWAMDAREAANLIEESCQNPSRIRELATMSAALVLKVPLEESFQLPPYKAWQERLGGCLMGVTVEYDHQPPMHRVISTQ